MSNTKSILFLFTDSYPYFTNEVYLETEIEYLANQFKKIFIFPINISTTSRKLPENVSVVNIHGSLNKSKQKFIFKSFALFFKILSSFNSRKLISKKIKKNFLDTYNALLYNDSIEKFIKENNINSGQVVAYSYWFLHWSYIISILKKNKLVQKAVSRTHMGDLYDDLCDHSFTEFKLNYLDNLFSISKDGKQHLKMMYPKYEHKLALSYLGVNYISKNPHSFNNKNYTIVSCSSMNKQKRIHSFFEILQNCELNINWVHFGGMKSEIEALLPKIKELPINIKTDFRGYTPNESILEYYQNNHIDLFLNLSLAEGIPVTIMEAISFGIPAMATNVCGSPEIVCYDNNMILEKYFNPNSVGKLIEDFLLNDANNDAYREKIFNFWNENFNAKKNYEEFAVLISA